MTLAIGLEIAVYLFALSVFIVPLVMVVGQVAILLTLTLFQALWSLVTFPFRRG